jgi:hypothetical protein
MNISAALEAFEVDSGNSVGNYSPKSVPSKSNLQRVPSYELVDGMVSQSSGSLDVDAALQLAPPSSSFHYHAQTVSSSLV